MSRHEDTKHDHHLVTIGLWWVDILTCGTIYVRIMRETLELDLIGCKAWIRGMEDMERQYQAMVLDLGIAQEQASSNASLVLELRSKASIWDLPFPLPSVGISYVGHIFLDLKMLFCQHN